MTKLTEMDMIQKESCRDVGCDNCPWVPDADLKFFDCYDFHAEVYTNLVVGTAKAVEGVEEDVLRPDQVMDLFLQDYIEDKKILAQNIKDCVEIKAKNLSKDYLVAKRDNPSLTPGEFLSRGGYT